MLEQRIAVCVSIRRQESKSFGDKVFFSTAWCSWVRSRRELLTLTQSAWKPKNRLRYRRKSFEVVMRPKSPVPLARPGRHGHSEVLPPGRSATDATAGLPIRAGLATRRARRGADRRPTPGLSAGPSPQRHSSTRQTLASRDGRMPVPERAAEGAGLETTTRLVRASLDRVARGCPNRGSRTRSGVDPTTSGFSLDPLRTTVLGSRSASGSCFQRRTSERATHGATGPQGWARRYPFFLSLQHGDF